MRKALLILAVMSMSAQADIILSTTPDVVVENQPNQAWGSPLPAECRGTFNYTTGKVTIEPRPEPSVSNQMRAPCFSSWLVNMVQFWNWPKPVAQVATK